MSKQIYQIIYYGDNNTKNSCNFPGVEKSTLGEYLKNGVAKEKAITQFGIQAPPGTTFCLQSNKATTQVCALQVGSTGIFELDLSNFSPVVDGIQFSESSVNRVNSALSGEYTYILIDFVIDDGNN